jgi:hypothetical protein
MALDITAQDIVVDETVNLQKDDIDPSVAPHDSNTTLQHLLTLGTALEVAFQADFVQASASAGETITSVVLTQDASGTPFSETDGVVTDIQTVDGNYVWLFQDPNNADVVIGVIGTDDPAAEPDPATDPLAFAFGLDHTSTTDADLYLVQYVALSHPDTSDPDDRIDLTDLVYASIEGTSQISFSGQNAAPGNHDFYLINSPDDASKQLLVIGLNGGTANVSEQGFGVDSQSINPNETLQVDFVTGGLLSAGTAAQIQYGSHIETITEAGFTINQITPSNPTARVDITIIVIYRCSLFGPDRSSLRRSDHGQQFIRFRAAEPAVRGHLHLRQVPLPAGLGRDPCRRRGAGCAIRSWHPMAGRCPAGAARHPRGVHAVFLRPWRRLRP